IAVGTFVVGFVTSLNTWSGQLLPGDLIVASGARTVALSARNTPMNDALRPQLAAIPGVQRVRSASFADIDFRGASVKVAAPDAPRMSHYRTLEGSEAELFSGLERGAVAVSESISRRFDVHRGDRIPLSTRDGTRSFEVVAVVIDYTSDRGTILMHRDTLRTAWGDDHVDSYELFMEPGVNPMVVRQTINDTLADKNDLFVLTTREFRGEFVKASDKIFSLLHALEVVTLAVAILGLITAMLANVLDRVRELGVMRALGMLRTQLRRMVVTEATLVGLVGAIGGIALGLGVGYILMRHIAGVQIGWYLPYELPLRSIVTMLAITLPISALAGFYPARQAGRLVVRDALDYE
ncbi:MAG TPA: FtsX-like permease family protein, partial [Polyangiales bacterium]